MTKGEFVPTVYLMRGCPFCMKLRLFLHEAGLLDQVQLRQFVRGSPEEETIVEELSQHLPFVGFPSVKVGPDAYASDSDEIIAWFASRNDIVPSALPTYSDFAEGVFKRYIALYRENLNLKRMAS